VRRIMIAVVPRPPPRRNVVVQRSARTPTRAGQSPR
jgi:hypothetical protein